MILHIGVIDVPEPEGSTTGEVADKLEEKYGIFTAFIESNLPFIVDRITESAAGALDDALNGVKTQGVFERAGDLITTRFKEFISLQEVEKLGIKGTPTMAALMGISYRTASGLTSTKVRGRKYKRVYGARRPSFIYSGAFQASLKCWVE